MNAKKDLAIPFNNRDEFSFFSLGRNAIYTACVSLGLKPGDIVLTPALDCDSTLSPFRVLGLKIDFYRSNPYTFEADIDNIKSRINTRVKLIHVINHFGIPQNWDSLIDLRQKTGIPILEDNAFSFFSKYNGKDFGTFGDFSIFSLNKIFPIIDGGMLRKNNDLYNVNLPKRTQKWFYKTERKKLLGILVSQLGLNKLPNVIKKKLVRNTIPITPLYSNKKGYPKWENRDKVLIEFSCDYYRPLSKIAEIQLKRYRKKDFLHLKQRIRYFYDLIVKKLIKEQGVQVLWPQIQKEIVPSCVCILVDTKRDDVFYRLKKKKFSVRCWPTFSGDVIDKIKDYPEIEIVGRKVIQLMIPVVRVNMKNADLYFKALTNELIESIRLYKI